MERKVVAGEIYRHFKGKLYQIIGTARHSETKEELIIYQALYGDFSMYARPAEMFLSKVDKEKYPEVQQLYRFEKVDKSELSEEKKPTKAVQASTGVKESSAEQEGEKCNEYLLEFLEAETVKEKKAILISIREKIDDRLINDISASMDIVIDEGPIDKRFASLLNCLNTMSKYECDRFR